MEDAINNELLINVTSSEIIIALLENKRLVELSREKNNKRFAVGDIYIGKVKKIMPGLNAAFVDVGYEKDAFLHYLDLGAKFRSLDNFVQRGIKEKSQVMPLDAMEIGPDINKEGKIFEVLTGGQQIMVQIAKEPISTKGPRLSSEVSIAGRHMVLIPFSNKISVSQKIKSNEERTRLKRLIQSIKPQNFGVIVRTAADNIKVAVLDQELRDLVAKWENAYVKLKNTTAPALIISELDRTSAMLRDILNASFNNIYVNNEAVYEEIKGFISSIAPEKTKILKLFRGRTPIFEQFNIDKQIKALFGKTVTIKSGAYLIIEHTEALHVIDVNSGNRSKKEKDQATTALEVNLLAAEEIARQLRLRDMGGIIVVDFIDMTDANHKKLVYEKMKETMEADRTKHNILPLSKFGLMQITRQRVRPEMHVSTAEMCPVCHGSGKISPSILLVDDIETNIRYILNTLSKTNLTIKVHPYVCAFLKSKFFSMQMRWILKYKRIIAIKAEESYNFMEYHFFNNKNEEIIL